MVKFFMKNKILILLCLSLCVFTFTGCGKDTSVEETKKENTTNNEEEKINIINQIFGETIKVPLHLAESPQALAYSVMLPSDWVVTNVEATYLLETDNLINLTNNIEQPLKDFLVGINEIEKDNLRKIKLKKDDAMLEVHILDAETQYMDDDYYTDVIEKENQIIRYKTLDSYFSIDMEIESKDYTIIMNYENTNVETTNKEEIVNALSNMVINEKNVEVNENTRIYEKEYNQLITINEEYFRDVTNEEYNIVNTCLNNEETFKFNLYGGTHLNIAKDMIIARNEFCNIENGNLHSINDEIEDFINISNEYKEKAIDLSCFRTEPKETLVIEVSSKKYVTGYNPFIQTNEKLLEDNFMADNIDRIKTNDYYINLATAKDMISMDIFIPSIIDTHYYTILYKNGSIDNLEELAIDIGRTFAEELLKNNIQ